MPCPLISSHSPCPSCHFFTVCLKERAKARTTKGSPMKPPSLGRMSLTPSLSANVTLAHPHFCLPSFASFSSRNSFTAPPRAACLAQPKALLRSRSMPTCVKPPRRSLQDMANCAMTVHSLLLPTSYPWSVNGSLGRGPFCTLPAQKALPRGSSRCTTFLPLQPVALPPLSRAQPRPLCQSSGAQPVLLMCFSKS